MFVKAYPRENSEAFYDGHVAAFEFFGCVHTDGYASFNGLFGEGVHTILKNLGSY